MSEQTESKGIEELAKSFQNPELTKKMDKTIKTKQHFDDRLPAR